MTRTYAAVLRGNHLEWTGPEPHAPSPVSVTVEIEEKEIMDDPEQRRRSVEALERIAQRGGIASSAESLLPDFSHLTADERIQLAMDLWDSVEPEDARLPLSEAKRAVLDRRIAAYERDPDAGEPWESVRDELLQDLDEFGNTSAA